MLKSENPNEPLWIAKIIYMFDKFPQKFMFHGQLFCRGSDTILGETADPRELFEVDDCENLPLGSIVRKAEVSKNMINKLLKLAVIILYIKCNVCYSDNFLNKYLARISKTSRELGRTWWEIKSSGTSR